MTKEQIVKVFTQYINCTDGLGEDCAYTIGKGCPEDCPYNYEQSDVFKAMTSVIEMFSSEAE